MSVFSIARKLLSTADAINAQKTEDIQCVHRNLTLRGLAILRTLHPYAADVFEPQLKILVAYSKRPDTKGDYENGMGRHYYCAGTVGGRERHPVNSYYKNGIGNLSKSARVMFEEDHTMAVTMYRAGFHDRAAAFLGRAIHMLSDMCCLPHAASMTYYSTGATFHKGYERLAEALYPEFVPLTIPAELPELFSFRSSFADDLNQIALETAKGLADVKADPKNAVISHLIRTERIVAAYLLRFYEDIHSSDRISHYIANNSGCRLLRGTAPLTARITRKGVTFHGVNPSPESDINVTSRTFYAAHRHDGLFTLSPVKDDKGKVLEVRGGKLVWAKFDPVHGEQLFRL